MGTIRMTVVLVDWTEERLEIVMPQLLDISRTCYI